VEPGHLGENITLDQVPESELRPGTRVRVEEVLLEVTKPCDPCTELHSLPYVGAGRGPEFVRTLVNRRGWYARVLIPGVVRVMPRFRSFQARSASKSDLNPRLCLAHAEDVD
jgi:MOSC domain-containing protein YiiM